jgi:hypothetical protein
MPQACLRRRRATFADLIFFGPLGDLGDLGVIDGRPHAKDARVAKKDRFTVASHLVCDVDVSGKGVEPERRRQAPTLQGSGGVVANLLSSLGVLCVMHVPILTAEDAERAEGHKGEEQQGPRSVPPCVRRRRATLTCRETTSNPNVGAKHRRYRGTGTSSRSSWRSWRASRDAGDRRLGTASHAKNAKVAKKDRFTVASHLVCDVDVRRSRI